MARAGDVVIAASLAAVDLEHLKFTVPLVVFHVEIGKAGKFDVLQEGTELPAQLRLVLRDDDGVVSDAVAGVLLQQNVAHTHEADLPVLSRVVGDHPHIGVVPGDEVLDDEGVLIAVVVDIVDDAVHLLPGLKDVGLLLGVKRVVPVGGGLGGLDHKGAGEGQNEVMALALVVDVGGGVVDAVLDAQLIEVLLVDELLHEVQADVRGNHVGGEF